MRTLSRSLCCGWMLLLMPAAAGFALPADQPKDIIHGRSAIASALHPPEAEDRKAEPADVVVAPIKRVRPKPATSAKPQPAKGVGQQKAKAQGSVGSRPLPSQCKGATGPAKRCAERAAKSKDQKDAAAKAGGKTASGVIRVKGAR